MTAFGDLAALVHEQHRLASGVETWRDCQLILCYRARELELREAEAPHSPNVR